jgi:hypothetical protein
VLDKLASLLRDPILEGIAAFLAILGVLLAIVNFLLKRFWPKWEDKIPGLVATIAESRLFFLALGISLGIVLYTILPTLGNVSPGEADAQVENSQTEFKLLPLYSQISEVAWNALGDKEYSTAISLAETCINSFEDQAIQINNTLSAGGKPFPPTGIVDDETSYEIFSHGVLNEVAACYFIHGQAFEALRCYDKARQAYENTQQFPYARVWSPADKRFWSPYEESTRILASLPSGDAENQCPFK